MRHGTLLFTSLAALFLLTFSSLSLARVHISTAPEPYPAYFGAQYGYASSNYKNANLMNGFTATSIKRHTGGVHVYLGYAFNQFFAAQFNVIWMYAKPAYRGLAAGTSGVFKNNLISLLFRTTVLLSHKLSAYLLFGPGYVARSAITVGGVTALSGGNIMTPMAGVGFRYHVFAHWVIDGTYLTSFAVNNRQLPAGHFVGLGGYYQFPL